MRIVHFIVITAMLACALPFPGLADAYCADECSEQDKKGATIKEVLDSLELEYNVRFVYDSSLSPILERPGKTGGSTLEQSLSILLSGTGIEWKIQKQYVVLKAGQRTAQRTRNRFTVSGFIYDNDSGETLIGAGATDGSIGAVTNNFGYYTLTLPGGRTALTYSYLGCEPVSLDIDIRKDTVVNVRLSQSSSIEASRIVARKDAGIASTY
ncbi:MAG: STN and carboxypeptidase regulatory-like domain-containing protein, partial [Candidatus Cryptobacteroides sp.]